MEPYGPQLAYEFAGRRLRVIDLDAPILPGQGAAGIRLGESAQELLSGLGFSPSPRAGLQRYVMTPVTIWTKDGQIDQVLVEAPYRGSLPQGIGIGSTIGEVEAKAGVVIEDQEDNLVVPSVPGWGFETELWKGHDLANNKRARVTQIFVTAG